MISQFAAGALHENHKALIAAGPWVFGGLEPARYENRPDGEGGMAEVPVCAGTCDICGQGICDVVRLRHATNGETRMLGIECALTFDKNVGMAVKDAKTGLMRVKRQATTRRKAEKLAIVLAPLRAEMTAWAAEDTFRANVARNALRVMDKGRRPSAEHMALIEKLRAEEPRPLPVRAARPAREEERHVAAPEGVAKVRGVIVSTKATDGQWGPVYRMTVKVTTDDGVYLVNGTIPRALFNAAEQHLENVDGWIYALKGCEVEFTATLSRGEVEHFAFANRPKAARLVAWPAEKAKVIEPAFEQPTDDPFATFDAA